MPCSHFSIQKKKKFLFALGCMCCAWHCVCRLVLEEIRAYLLNWLAEYGHYFIEHRKYEWRKSVEQTTRWWLVLNYVSFQHFSLIPSQMGYTFCCCRAINSIRYNFHSCIESTGRTINLKHFHSPNHLLPSIRIRYCFIVLTCGLN